MYESGFFHPFRLNFFFCYSNVLGTICGIPNFNPVNAIMSFC